VQEAGPDVAIAPRNASTRRQETILRRILICVTPIALLAFAATALAGTKSYHGHATGGGTVTFKAIVRHGEIQEVKDFTFKRVPMQCDEGEIKLRDEFTGSTGVHRRKFRFTGNDNGAIATAFGKFNRRGPEARGTLSVDGDPRHRGHNCQIDTRWRAQHR
jgi:hypothetical protein